MWETERWGDHTQAKRPRLDMTDTYVHTLSSTHTEHKKNSRRTLSSSQPDKHFVSGVEKTKQKQ